ncbi:MAG: HAD-IIA family hydrolase [Microthrixaceae bacterium]
MATWVIDLDGVMWWGERTIAGAPGAVDRLRSEGHTVVFCTNHALAPEVKQDQLAAHGVTEALVVTSAEAAAARCEPGSTVLVLGDPSLVEVVRASGREAVDARAVGPGGPPPVDAVVVGAHEDWDRSRTGWAADAVRTGATFLATNADPTFPHSGPAGPRLLPGAGAIIAAVAVAAGREPEVCGKPHAAMAELLVARHGPVDVVVGDLPSTDGELALRLGARFGLVLSGVTGRGDLPVRPDPWAVADDLAGLVAGAR